MASRREHFSLSWIAFLLGALPYSVPLGAQSLPPETWATQVIQNCQRQEDRYVSGLARLEARYTQQSLSKEELDFIRQERAAASRDRAADLKLRIQRLEFLLFGNSRRSFLEAVREVPSLRDVKIPRSFAAVLQEGGIAPSSCVLDRLEGAIVLSAFGLAPSSDSDEWLTIPKAYLEVRGEYRKRVARGQSLQAVFLALRPVANQPSAAYPQALLSRLQSPAANPLSNGYVDALTSSIKMAGPALRIQTYAGLRAQAEEVRRALLFPDKQIERLREQLREKLFSSKAQVVSLNAAPPESILPQVESIFASWLSTAESSIAKLRTQRGHARHWHNVESGLTAIESGAPSPSAKLSAFIPHFVALERRLSSVSMDRAEFLKAAKASGAPAGALANLDRITHSHAKINTRHLYQQLLADAAHYRGSLDRTALRIGLDTLAQEKRGELNRFVSNLPEAQTNARLKDYLLGAGASQIDFELLQARKEGQRISTGGGAVGWLLRHLSIGGSVPGELWIPEGVGSEEFAALIDGLAGRNESSGVNYAARQAAEVRYVASGEPYRREVANIIGSAKNFINIQAFDWKVDMGGKEMTYRLMGRKLGIDAASYDRLVDNFRGGLPLRPGQSTRVPFYDLDSKQAKNFLVYWAFASGTLPAFQNARRELESALGAPLRCPSLENCGDLGPLFAKAGAKYDGSRAGDSAYRAAWDAFRNLESMFTGTSPSLERVRPRPSLAAYIQSRDALQTLVRRHGARRADRPEEPLPINIVTDGKQNLNNIKWFRLSRTVPFIYSDPANDLYLPLVDFDIDILLWKGLIEFPWHLGPLPIPGRKIGGFFPMPYVPYPWLKAVPGFGWAGTGTSLLAQHVLATDVRTWWAMSMHSKNVSNESVAMESGMGLATKYMNVHSGFPTWHDAAVVSTGPIVGDANDQFVASFNRARVNNAGLARSRGAKVPRLRYQDYQHSAAPPAQPTGKSWLLTTDPDGHDYNYRAVFMAALAAARKNIYIENVFYSDPLITKMLLHKAREFRGRVDCAGLNDWECAEKKNDAVDIHLIVPDHTDKTAVDAVGFAQFFDMVQAGVKIYRWNPPTGWSHQKLIHTKAWLVDYEPGQVHGSLAYVGSHNANQRSHFTDNEVGILSSTPDFSRQVFEELFQADIQRDTRRETRDFFELERRTTKGARFGKWLAKVFVDYSWFF